jgi:WD40 repeat protein
MRFHIARSIPSPILCFAALIAIVVYVAASTSDTNVRSSVAFPDKLCFHRSIIDGIAFSPSGHLLASASLDGTTKVCDVATRRPRAPEISGVTGFSGVDFSPDGLTLASAGLDGRVVIRDLQDGRAVRTFRANETEGSVRVAVFSPEGDTLATGGDDRAVHVWDVPSGRELMVMRGHGATVKGLVYTPDGRAIISVSADGRAISWDARTGRIREQIDCGCGPLWSIAISGDGRWVALGGRDGITLRDLVGGRSRSHQYFQGTITSLCFLPCGTILASASLEGSITLWKVGQEGLRPWRTLEGQEGRVRALAVSPDGKTLVTGGDDAILRFWKI